MKDAATTWAVVVGIDAYAELKPLTGAVADAATAVAWLRRLGVPDAQILLHVAPTPDSKPTADAIGLPFGGCTQPEVWASFEKLMKNTGSRLFVFLCGHGFFEPGGHRVFLTSEARQLVMTNLHIEAYAAFLRGLPYSRQFVVMDGCLNLPYTASERAKIKPGEPPVELPPRADVAQWLCTAASQGERAAEEDNHGLFLPALLSALDLDNPNDECVAIDERYGTIELDLIRAVDSVAGPTVVARAIALGRSQHPGIQRLDAGPAMPRVAVAAKAPETTAQIRVDVQPPDAVPDVRRIRLSTDDYLWESAVPKPPATAVACPVESVLPAGMHVSVRCTMKDTGWVQPSQQEFVAPDGARTVVFEVERPGERPDAVVNTVRADGEVDSGMEPKTYAEVDRILRAEGMTFDEHETGPVLHAPRDFDRLPQVAMRVARAIDRLTDEHIAARVVGVDMASVRTALRFSVDASRLAGLLADEPVVRVGEQTFAPNGLAEVDVEPGRVPVEVTLPWGRWATVVLAPEGETTDVTLPVAVGLPPLRVLLPGGGDAPGRTVATTGTPFEGVVWSAAWLIGTTSNAVVGRIDAAPDLMHWGAAMSRATADCPRWRAVAVGRDLAFPLNENGTVGVDLGTAPRAEPLARIRAPEWDALATSGRLEEVTPEAAVALTQAKWFDPLLGLAGAYACYAHGHDEYLGIVLDNLGRIDDGLPDVPLLAGASDRRLGRQRPEVAHALSEFAAVPLFRWGVSAGVLAAEHYGLGLLAASLGALEHRLVPSSVWTMFHR